MKKQETKANDIDNSGNGMPAFLSGGGEMGQLIRDFDWARTPVGDPDDWPQSLRTTVRLMLHTQHPMFLYWGEGLTCFYNDAFRATMGPERHPSSMGASGREVWAEIWHIIGPEIELTMTGGGSTWNENKLIPITRHGKVENIWWSYSFSPIDEESAPNGIGGTLVICTDVSVQHKASEALKLEGQRLMDLFKQAPGFIAVVYGKDHIFNIANDAYRRLVNGRDVVGMSVREALPELQGQGFYELLDRVYATGQHFIGENLPISLQRTSDSPIEKRYVSFIYQPIRNHNDEVIGIFAEGQDNTEAKLTEIKLREALENNTAIIENTKDLICIFDPAGNFYSINDCSQTILGYEPHEVIGRSYTDFLVNEDISAAVEMFSNVLSGTSVTDFETRCVHKDGHIVHMIWSAVWVEEQGKLFAIGKDITERLKSEELARHAQRSDAIGQLTGGVAHDFNNLLTVILGNAELLTSQLPANSDYYSLSSMILKAAERGAELTQRLLAFARQQPLAPKPVDIEKMINELNGLLKRTLGSHIEIDFVCHNKLNLALVDEGQLENAILNLCINARDAMSNGGRLTLLASDFYIDDDYASKHAEVNAGPYVMISVSDTGSGIAPENIQRVFEPFFTTKDIGKGTGLGLPMVMGFMKQSKGHVTIDSELGQGTIVKLFIPQANAGIRQEIAPAIDLPGRGHETVLLVEDDDLVRQFATTHLGLLGYTVIPAENGAVALEIIRQRDDIDLLFTDIVMPGGISGRDVATEAKAIRPNLKVLYTSGYSSDALFNQDTQSQIQLLTKPYSRVELAQSIRRAIGT